MKVFPGEVLRLVYSGNRYYFRKPDSVVQAPFGWHRAEDIEFVEEQK